MKFPDWISRLLEADPERYVPYAGHIEREAVMLMDGSRMGMLQLHGLPFELEPASIRNDREDRLNAMLRAMADNDLIICFHLCRHRSVSQAPQPEALSPFVRDLMRDYRRAAIDGKAFRNDWFVSVVVRPGAMAKSLRQWIPFAKPAPVLGNDRNQKRKLDDAMQFLVSTLAEYQPRRLGIAEVPTDIEGETLPVSEIATALHLIRTGRLEPIPHVTGSLGASVLTAPVVVGPTAFDLNKPGPGRYGAMIAFREYPARPRVGMFNTLLSAPYPLVMTHSFAFRSGGAAIAALALTQQQMRNSGDRAKSLMEGLDKAMDDTASGITAPGTHNFSLAVYADDLASLDVNAADAAKRISESGGASATREMNVWYNGALETTYYAQLPGTAFFKARPGDISTDDLACMASLENFPTGAASGYWGPSPIRFRTRGGTTYDLITHDDDVGHSLVVGRIGGGKTVLLGMLIAALEPVMGENGIRLVIDKDEGNRLLIEACGGSYVKLCRNQESGLAPLRAFDDSPASRAFFQGLYTWLIRLDGRRPLTGAEEARLARGIARQLRMAPEKRSMGGVREYLGYEDPENGAGARFEKWCRGGSMGRLLDNERHVITVGAGLYGFDFTDLIPREGQEDDGSCAAAAAVIMHQLSQLMDGRRIAAFFDECRFYLEPLARMIEDFTLTGRKKELACFLVAQQPEHFTDSDIGRSLVSQMRTKFLFPDANGSEEGYASLQIPAPAIRQLKGDMTLGNGRRFLIWRAGAPAICEFDLSGLPQLPILSGRPGTIRLMERVRKEVDSPEVVPEFIRRYQNARKAA